MRSAKWLTAAGTLAVASLAITACTSGGAPEETDTDIALRMTVWTSNEEQLALFDSIADAYMEDHPEVTSVTFDPLDFTSYSSTLTTQIAGGNAPDMAWILENAAPDFVSSGALAPLEDTLADTEGYELDDLSEAASALWRDADGKLVAYPFSTSPFVMFVNNDLLAAAGQPTGAEMLANGWTWDDVSAAGSAVNQATGKAGFVVRDFEYQTWDLLSTVWNGWGATPWSEDGATCTMDSDEMVGAFEFLHDAAFDAKSMPGPGTTADFFAGESAFTVSQISRASLLADSGITSWDLLPLPEGPAGEYSMVGQAGLAAMAQGEHPKAAADFIAYFTNPENSKKLAQYFPPARESQINAETLSAANPVLSEAQLADVVVPAISSGVVRPSHTNSAEIQQTVRSALDAIWTPDADVSAVLGDVCGAMQPLLEG